MTTADRLLVANAVLVRPRHAVFVFITVTGLHLALFAPWNFSKIEQGEIQQEVQVSIEISDPQQVAIPAALDIPKPLMTQETVPVPLTEPVPRPEPIITDQSEASELEQAQAIAHQPERKKQQVENSVQKQTIQDARLPTTGVRYQLGSTKNPRPVYPSEAFFAGVQGEVILEVEVFADGSPGTIRLLRSSGSELLDNSAISAVRKWEFSPAIENGVTVTQFVEIPIHFRLLRR